LIIVGKWIHHRLATGTYRFKAESHPARLAAPYSRFVGEVLDFEMKTREKISWNFLRSVLRVAGVES
jgi:hypothetical protein